MFAGSVTSFRDVHSRNILVPYESFCVSWLGLSVECSKATVSKRVQPLNA